ncbi:MAG: hypothetical protein RL553_967 [Planctomycetota bacterium]|jgi:hypothetical protein
MLVVPLSCHYYYYKLCRLQMPEISWLGFYRPTFAKLPGPQRHSQIVSAKVILSRQRVN